MSLDRKRNFLDAVPRLLDDVQAIDRELGREPHHNWSEFERLMTDLLKQRGSRWRATERKLFREVFTDRDAEAEPVVLKERKASGDQAPVSGAGFLIQRTQLSGCMSRTPNCAILKTCV